MAEFDFTDEQYRDFARKWILAAAEEANEWGDIGEHLTSDRHRKRVAELIRAAKVTITWPDDQRTAHTATEDEERPAELLAQTAALILPEASEIRGWIRGLRAAVCAQVVEILQHMREEGDQDMRQAIARVQALVQDGGGDRG